MHSIKKLIQSYLFRKDGTTAVEFALIAFAFLSIIFGIIELGRYFFTWNAFQYAVENGTRYALVNDGITAEALTEYVAGEMQGVLIDTSTLTMETPAFTTVSGVNFIEIEGTYVFSTFAPLLPDSWDVFTLEARSKLPIP